MSHLSRWLDQLVLLIATSVPDGTFLSYSFNVKGLLAVILVGLVCGAVGSLVVGNRMAFFSDALAHCTFAGVALGLLSGLIFNAPLVFYQWGVPTIMVLFGILVGVGIAYVKEATSLASDTVIGVFFAGAIGFGAILMKQINKRAFFNPENFLFGSPVSVTSEDLLTLLALAVLTFCVLGVFYNQIVFTSFNTSLAMSRRIPVRLCNYLFIVLLALIINLGLKIVGALLINALLIVPVATASNVCRNMRQLFWVTTGLCLTIGVGGQLLSWEFNIADGGGMIVVLGVTFFFFSMLVPFLRNRVTG